MAEKKIVRADDAANKIKQRLEKSKEATKDEVTETVEDVKEDFSEAVDETGEKAEEVKEEVITTAKGKKKIKKADGTVVQTKPAAPAKEKENAVPYRIGAVAAWVVAIVFEVLAVLVLFGKINLTFLPVVWQLIVFLLLDLICVCVGSLLWKKANRIDPASKKNKVKFWLWNNMGLIVCAFAFIPFIIITLTNKNADKKTKTIATIVAIIALLIGGLFSYDWNPVSAEEKDAAIEALGDTEVYWAPFGSVYHTSPDCSHLNHSETLTVGTVQQAIEANRTRLCKTCEARDNINIDVDKSADDDEIVIDDADDEAVQGDEIVIED